MGRRTQNPGAEPLRIGERYCAAHANQAARLATACEVSSSFVPPSCASCGALHGGLSQDTDSLDEAEPLWYCSACWRAWDWEQGYS